MSEITILEILLPKVLPPDVSFTIYAHEGKQDLEHALQKTVPTISKIPGARVLVTRDQDSADCKEVKQHLLGLLALKVACDYKVRVVCRELESWYLGDLDAVEQAYPRFKAEQHRSKADFRNVDALAKPSETLKRLLPDYQQAKYLPKLEVAKRIGESMDPSRNTSTSFMYMLQAVEDLVA